MGITLWIVLAIVQLIYIPGGAAFNTEVLGVSGLTYSREDLLSLRNAASSTSKLTGVIPAEIHQRRRKHGKRGGVRARLQRCPFRPPLPSVVMSNVQSLRSKMDILHARC